MTALFWVLAVLAYADTFQVVAAGTARCRDGWTYYDVTKLCYAYFIRDWGTDYFQAIDKCKDAGGIVASPHTKEDLDFVYNIRPAGARYIWVGLDDRETEGTYRWQDGQELQYDAWIQGGPTGDPDKDCVMVNDDGGKPFFEEHGCSQGITGHFCQVASATDPCDELACENNGVCNSASGVAVCDCPMGYTGERCEKIKTVSYEVIVFTPAVASADTDAYVYIRIIGESGTSFDQLLDNVNLNDFEQGQTDTFAFTAADVGNINTVTIWHDDSGYKAGSGWLVGYVIVRKYEYQSSAYYDYTFNCDCWLAVDKGDRSLSRTLENPKVSYSG